MTLDALLPLIAIFGAGLGAGFINVIVGSGTLITFPVLLMFGYPALTANMSSNLGLIAGNFSGVYGYRREIAHLKPLVKKLLPASLLGGVTGALLLLVLPSSVFDFAVPILILIGIIMVVISPMVQKRTAAKLKAAGGAGHHDSLAMARPALTFLTVAALGLYGGYFGAAQGVLMVGSLGMLLTVSLQSLNALKNALVAGVNVVSAIIFVLFAGDLIDWTVVLLLAAGAALGGLLGAKVGRSLPPSVLRAVIVVIGTIALINMVT